MYKLALTFLFTIHLIIVSAKDCEFESDDSLWEDPNVQCSSFCFKALHPMLRYVEANHRKWNNNEGDLKSQIEAIDSKLSSFLSSQKKLEEKIDNLENLFKSSLSPYQKMLIYQNSLDKERVTGTNYQKIGSKTIYFEDKIEVTWQEAFKSCQLKNRSLLTFETKEEIQPIFPKLRSMEYWIGINKNEQNIPCASLTKYGHLSITSSPICSEKHFFICQDKNT